LAGLHINRTLLAWYWKTFPLVALYSLSHTSSPFCSVYLGDGGLVNYLPRLSLNHNPPDYGLPCS
jgi:hypothetical protein